MAVNEPANTETPLRCQARTHGTVVDGLVIIRCNDAACPDAQRAKLHGTRAFHVWNAETGELVGTMHRPGKRKTGMAA